MARTPAVEIVDLRHFLPDDAGEPPSRVRKRGIFYGDLARFGTLRPPGVQVDTPVRCRRRPNHQPCPGVLTVWRQDAPPVVGWECGVCGVSGSISGFEDTEYDLSALRTQGAGGAPGDGVPDDTEPVHVSLAVHAALRELASADPRWLAPVYGATAQAGRATLRLPRASRNDYASAALMAALQQSSPRRAGLLVEAAQTLGDVDAARRRDVGRGAESQERAAEQGAFLELGSVPAVDLRAIFASVPFEARRPAAPRQAATRSAGRRSRRPAAEQTYRIKVSLRDARPPIWRRLVVPADLELCDLHEVLQLAMGWLDCHLHLFRVRDEVFAPDNPDLEPLGADTRSVRLRDLAPRAGSRLVYEYDFGDGWCHDILVEEVRDEPCARVRCLAGRRACPPEDCGGIWGYREFCAAIADPRHEDHAQLVEWIGRAFDPERFDLEETDAMLGEVRVGPRGGARGPGGGHRRGR